MGAGAEGYIVADIIVTKEGNQYSSWCPILDIASCEDSPEEAISNLQDAVELYLNTLSDEGELEKVLKEKSIQIVHDDVPVIPQSFVTQYRQKIPIATQ